MTDGARGSDTGELIRGSSVPVGQGQLQQQRIENVHMLVALGILGWYVTSHQDKLVHLDLTTDGFFFGFAVIAGIFVAGKVNTITLRRTRQESRYIRYADEMLLPLFFFASLNGVIATLVFYSVYSALPLPENDLIVSVFILIVTVVVSRYLAKSWDEYTDDLRYQDEEFEQRIAKIQSSELERLVFEYPELIEEGFHPMKLQWRYRVNGLRVEADIFGIDIHGAKTVVEVRNHVTAKVVSKFISSVVERVEDMRPVLAGISVTEDAEALIEESDVEFIEIDRAEAEELMDSTENDFVG